MNYVIITKSRGKFCGCKTIALVLMHFKTKHFVFFSQLRWYFNTSQAQQLDSTDGIR